MSKARGSAFERTVKAVLEDAGWFAVRSAASLSPVDLLAVCPDEVAFVQCKVTRRLDPAEWNELLTLAMRHGGVPVLVSRAGRGKLRWERLLDFKPETGYGRRDLTDEWSPVRATEAAA